LTFVNQMICGNTYVRPTLTIRGRYAFLVKKNESVVGFSENKIVRSSKFCTHSPHSQVPLWRQYQLMTSFKFSTVRLPRQFFYYNNELESSSFMTLLRENECVYFKLGQVDPKKCLTH